MNKLKFHQLQYLPRELEAGVLYYSEEFNVVGHLCPCGCGNKVITPIGSMNWSITIEGDKPTLYPSLGNWQLPCRSHYWIIKGQIEWSNNWTDEEIQEGWQAEETRRRKYFDGLQELEESTSIYEKIKSWILFVKSKLKI